MSDDTKVKEAIDNHIGKRCMEWWNELPIDKQDVENCMYLCTTARVGMGRIVQTIRLLNA